MPEFLIKKLKAEYGKDSKTVYKVLKLHWRDAWLERNAKGQSDAGETCQGCTEAQSMNFEPTGDRVLIRRIEERSAIMLTDQGKSIKGIVLAVGPGKYDEEGDFIPTTLKAGDKVLFNSKWNDLAHAENVGTGADGSGKLERPLSYKLDPLTHLVTEGDIFAVVPHLDFRASLGQPIMEKEHFINREIAGPWSSPENH